jgi:AcrR family transcriptional regulator
MRRMSTVPSQIRRADAQRHRRTLLEVASSIYAAEGLNVPLREIARRSGFGVATLYRHFPSRDALIEEVLRNQVDACTTALTQLAETADARQAVGAVIDWFTQQRITSHGLLQALVNPHSGADAFEADRQEHRVILGALLSRAARTGALRASTAPEDVALALLAISSLPQDRIAQTAPRLATLLKTALLAPNIMESEEAGDQIAGAVRKGEF